MGDPRFAQSVIYVCAHTDEGAMGIVVNRPLASPSFSDLLKQLGVDPVPPARSIRLCQGGPVDHARGFVLHTADWTGDGSLRVDAQTALTASLDILKAIAAGGGPAQGMLALGYAGWGPGQLEAEFAQNAWLSVLGRPGAAVRRRARHEMAAGVGEVEGRSAAALPLRRPRLTRGD